MKRGTGGERALRGRHCELGERGLGFSRAVSLVTTLAPLSSSAAITRLRRKSARMHPFGCHEARQHVGDVEVREAGKRAGCLRGFADTKSMNASYPWVALRNLRGADIRRAAAPGLPFNRAVFELLEEEIPRRTDIITAPASASRRRYLRVAGAPPRDARGARYRGPPPGGPTRQWRRAGCRSCARQRSRAARRAAAKSPR